MSISWHLMFRVKKRAAFQRCLSQTLPLLGEVISQEEGKPYWKIPELWECAVETPLLGHSFAEQVLGCLHLANRLGVGWYVLGPSGGDDWAEFNGTFSLEHSGSSKVIGLEWASFHARFSTVCMDPSHS
jgi:hypothetical protein